MARTVPTTALAKAPKGDTGASIAPVVPVVQFVSAEHFKEMQFWSGLETKERTAIQHEGRELLRAVQAHGASKLAIGEHLKNIKTTLIPHRGAWDSFLQSFVYKFTRRTAERYITAYENIHSRFPAAIVNAAMVRDMPILAYDSKKPLGIYTSAVKALPPPKNPTPAEAGEYLDKLDAKVKRQRTAAAGKEPDLLDEFRSDPVFMQKHSFRIVKNNIMRLPPRQRRGWLTKLVGMLLTEINSSTDLIVSAIDIPEDFNQGKGRPKLVRDEPEATSNSGTLEATG